MQLKLAKMHLVIIISVIADLNKKTSEKPYVNRRDLECMRATLTLHAIHKRFNVIHKLYVCANYVKILKA